MMVPRNDEELIQLWRTGLTMTDIGERVGLSREHVRQRLKKHGITGHNPNCIPSPERIHEAITTELSLNHVARLLGVSVQLLIRGIDHADMYDEVEGGRASDN
jgi:hypothetical protein